MVPSFISSSHRERRTAPLKSDLHIESGSRDRGTDRRKAREKEGGIIGGRSEGGCRTIKARKPKVVEEKTDKMQSYIDIIIPSRFHHPQLRLVNEVLEITGTLVKADRPHFFA